MRKILITGTSGFLGFNLLRQAPSNAIIYVAAHQKEIPGDPANAISLDITNIKTTMEAIKTINPDVIIHAAALADPGQCFKNQSLAMQVNVDGSINIAKAAKAVNARFIFISTDLVYKGDSQNYDESQAGDCCFYGQTKLDAEQSITEIMPNAFIARIALLFGIGHVNRRCFAEQVIENVRKGDTANLFTDEYRCPLQVNNLCEILFEAAVRPEIQGIYNIGSPDRISRYDFIKTICQRLNLDTNLLNPTRISDINFAEPRPADCSMNITKAQNIFKTSLLPLAKTIPQIWP
ncbi:MAG: SDR family oxidoreductase [Phycisphaerae bacterium]|nr:SDR family oxidoreductase [Phycisphaerae bacterium]